MEVNVRGVLERDERAPAVAREFVTSTLRQWGRPELSADAVLLVDELVTNALRHVRFGVVQLDLSCTDDLLRVDVSDAACDFVEGQAPQRPSDVPRMGLRIVDSVADRWGVLFSPSGKSVWFELDVITDRLPAELSTVGT